MPKETPFYYESRATVEKVKSFITDRMDHIYTLANEANDVALSTIDKIGLIDTPTINMKLPDSPELGVPTSLKEAGFANNGESIVPTVSLSIDAKTAGFQQSGTVSAPSLTNIPSPKYGKIEEVTTRPTGTLEAPPVNYETVSSNAVPTMGKINVPEAPVLNIDARPTLNYVNVAGYTPTSIGLFNAVMPDNAQLQSLMQSNSANIDGLVAQANSILATIETDFTAVLDNIHNTFFGIDGTGNYISSTVDIRNRHRMMLANKASQIHTEKSIAIEEATAKAASSGFSIPPGSLVSKVNELTINANKKLTKESIAINEKKLKEEEANFFAKVQSLYKLEAMSAGLQIEVLQKTLKNELLLIKSHMMIFNDLLTLVNSKIQIYETYINSIDPAISAVDEQNSWVDTALSAVESDISTDKASMSMFNAQLDVSKAQANIKKQQAHASNLDAERTALLTSGYLDKIKNVEANIKSYKTAINCYADYVKTTSEEVDSYSSEVFAILSGSQVIDANIKAESSYIKADKGRTFAAQAYVGAQSDVLKSNVGAYREAAAVNESYVNTVANHTRELSRIESVRVRAYEEYAKANSSLNRANISITDAKASSNLIQAENESRVKSLQNKAKAETDAINAGALAAKAKSLSAIAQSAISVVTLSASTGASTSIGSSFNSNYQASQSEIATHSQIESTQSNHKIDSEPFP